MSDLKASLVYAVRAKTEWRALRVSVFVGTLLAVINHYDEWVNDAGSTTSVIQIVLTYLVSTHGQVYGRRDR